jgi:heptosyltransferase II
MNRHPELSRSDSAAVAAGAVDKTQLRRMLVIQTAFLGDAVLITPVLGALKRSFPRSDIDVVAIPQTRDLFRYHPAVRAILTINKKNALLKPFSFLRLLFRIRKNRYDAAVSVQGSMTSSLLMKLGGVPRRIGFARQKLLTDRMFLDRNAHAAIRHLNLLKSLTNKTFDPQTELYWSEKEKRNSESILDGVRKEFPFVLGIAPGSIWPTKRWPEEHFVELLKILSRFPVKVFLFGGREDRALCGRIIEKSGTKAANMAGALTLLESCSLIHEIDLMLTNDSAPLHLANAVHTDVFALFGPTVKGFGFYPFRKNDRVIEVNLACRPCAKHGGRRCPEGHFRCMRDILPSAVARLILDHARSRGGIRPAHPQHYQKNRSGRRP